MPVTGRAACSAGESTRPSERHDSKQGKAMSSLSPQKQPRRESSAHGSPTQRPGLKNRAYSAPLVPKSQLHGPDGGQLENAPSTELREGDQIAKDPFFQRYDFPQADETADDDKSSNSPHNSSDTEGPLSPTHLKGRPVALAEPLSVPASPILSHGTETHNMQDINICLLGDNGVGKSAFIQRAFDIQTTVPSTITSRKMSVDGNVYTVRLLELSFSDITIDDGGRLIWPNIINDLQVRIDGALALYDIMNQESLRHIPETLEAIHNLPLPCALVACKCDQHPAHREIDPCVVEQRAKRFMEEMPVFQISDSSSDAQKQCLSVMLRAIIASRHDQPKVAIARRRANSSAMRHPSPRPSLNRHERASSEFSGFLLMAAYEKEAESRFPGNARSSRYKSGDGQHTFLDTEESPDYESQGSDRPSSADDQQSIITDLPSDEKGYTFDQLVNRLLAQPLSKNDTKFVAIFLALYRRFATPRQLLEAIIQRFEALKRDKNPQMIRTIAQLRHLAILEQWIRFYPGDFAYPTTRRKMRKFISGLASNRMFSVAAREMMYDLEFVVEDDDTDWACSDRNRERDDSSLQFTTALEEDSGDEDVARVLSQMSFSGDGSQTGSRPVTVNSTSLSFSTTTTTTNTSHNVLSSVEHAQRQAKLLVPIPRTPFTKVQWHLLMGDSEENIARELTRIDWIMFSSIHPRDLVRHVSLNSEEKKRCKSLENVNRMIEQFNHLAYVVTNYILFRDKPKHRALMLEKWMKIARKVRELNNYNSLGAILAGINGTAVHRLVATRELVAPQVSKDFMKLEILMGTQKSHFAYRLAWENSSGERIPYLPLHRRDLVSTNEGNSTFVGDRKSTNLPLAHPGVSVFSGGLPGTRDSREALPGGVIGKERINWKKFEIMGEVIVGVQRAQGTPYPALPRNDDVRRLLLDIIIQKDDEELYERSVHLEAGGASKGGSGLNWFKR